MQLTTEQAAALLQLAHALDACQVLGITVEEFESGSSLVVYTGSGLVFVGDALTGDALRSITA